MRVRWRAAALAASALVLSGCGDVGSEPSGTLTSAATEEAPRPPSVTPHGDPGECRAASASGRDERHWQGGAQAAAEHFLRVVEYTHQTLDAGPLEALDHFLEGIRLAQ